MKQLILFSFLSSLCACGPSNESNSQIVEESDDYEAIEQAMAEVKAERESSPEHIAEQRAWNVLGDTDLIFSCLGDTVLIDEDGKERRGTHVFNLFVSPSRKIVRMENYRYELGLKSVVAVTDTEQGLTWEGPGEFLSHALVFRFEEQSPEGVSSGNYEYGLASVDLTNGSTMFGRCTERTTQID